MAGSAAGRLAGWWEKITAGSRENAVASATYWNGRMPACTATRSAQEAQGPPMEQSGAGRSYLAFWVAV